MGNRSGRDDRKAAAAEKQQRALALRRAGATYDMIAKELGLADGSNAHRLVSAAIAAIPREDAKAVLGLELERLDAILRGGLFERARTGDFAAIDRVVRIMERRAAYLGIDAPKRTQAELTADVTTTDGSHASVLAKLNSLAAALGTGGGDPEPERGGGD